MNCQKFEPLLIAYADGRAADAERAEVDRHLLACAACREKDGMAWLPERKDVKGRPLKDGCHCGGAA